MPGAFQVHVVKTRMNKYSGAAQGEASSGSDQQSQALTLVGAEIVGRFRELIPFLVLEKKLVSNIFATEIKSTGEIS